MVVDYVWSWCRERYICGRYDIVSHVVEVNIVGGVGVKSSCSMFGRVLESLAKLLCLGRVCMVVFMYGLNFGDEVPFKEGRL